MAIPSFQVQSGIGPQNPVELNFYSGPWVCVGPQELFISETINSPGTNGFIPFSARYPGLKIIVIRMSDGTTLPDDRRYVSSLNSSAISVKEFTLSNAYTAGEGFKTWLQVPYTAGSTGEVQFNNNNAFGASSNLTFDTSTNTLGTHNVSLAGNLSFNTAGAQSITHVGSAFQNLSISSTNAAVNVEGTYFDNNRVHMFGDLTASADINLAKSGNQIIRKSDTGNLSIFSENGTVLIEGTVFNQNEVGIYGHLYSTSDINLTQEGNQKIVKNTDAGVFAITSSKGPITINGNTFSANDIYPTLPGSVNLMNQGATTLKIGAGATTGITIGSNDTITSTPVNIGGNTGKISIGTQNAAKIIEIGTAGNGPITLGNASISGGNSVKIDSGTGNIDIGTGSQARSVNLGTGAAPQTVTIGSNNTTSTTAIKGGTSVTLGGAAATTYTIGETTTTGDITIGQSQSSNTINVGNAAVTNGNQTINIGSATHTGTGKSTITIGSTSSDSSLKLQSGTGNIDIGTTNAARSVNLGTGAAAQTVTIGSTTGASSLKLQSGTGDITIDSTDNVTIGRQDPGYGVINVPNIGLNSGVKLTFGSSTNLAEYGEMGHYENGFNIKTQTGRDLVITSFNGASNSRMMVLSSSHGSLNNGELLISGDLVVGMDSSSVGTGLYADINTKKTTLNLGNDSTGNPNLMTINVGKTGVTTNLSGTVSITVPSVSTSNTQILTRNSTNGNIEYVDSTEAVNYGMIYAMSTFNFLP